MRCAVLQYAGTQEAHPYRGVEQLEARRAHNPEVVGSSPASATKKYSHPFGWLYFLSAQIESVLRSSGYETGERSSLGKRADCRRWREEGGERSAAVASILKNFGEGFSLFRKCSGLFIIFLSENYKNLLHIRIWAVSYVVLQSDLVHR